MKLYFLRHGQSEANLRGIHGGWLDCDLTETGRAQAAHAAPLLQKISFEKIYSSDLPRALQTAQLACPGADIQQTPLLREINVGAVMGMTPAACKEKWGEHYANARAMIDFTYFSGENSAQVGQRMRAFLDEVARKHTGNVLAVSHNHAINTVLNHLYGTQEDEMAWMANCGISVFEYKNGKWMLLQWNITGADPL